MRRAHSNSFMELMEQVMGNGADEMGSVLAKQLVRSGGGFSNRR